MEWHSGMLTGKESYNPHGHTDVPFVIRRLVAAESGMAPQIPSAVARNTCFLYLSEGELLADAGAEPFIVRKGEILIIPGGMEFSVKYHDGSVGYMGAFSDTFMDNMNYRVLQCRQVSLVEVPENDMELVDRILERLLRTAPDGRDRKLEVSALGLFLELADSFMTGPSVINMLCSRFLEMVFERRGDILAVAGYASRLGVSPNHLNRTVKRCTGRSAGDWVDISRLALAKYLLRRTGMPVIDVASAAGFDDQSYFSRFFKRHTGLTPTDFRRRSEGR